MKTQTTNDDQAERQQRKHYEVQLLTSPHLLPRGRGRKCQRSESFYLYKQPLASLMINSCMATCLQETSWSTKCFIQQGYKKQKYYSFHFSNQDRNASQCVQLYPPFSFYLIYCVLPVHLQLLVSYIQTALFYGRTSSLQGGNKKP